MCPQVSCSHPFLTQMPPRFGPKRPPGYGCTPFARGERQGASSSPSPYPSVSGFHGNCRRTATSGSKDRDAGSLRMAATGPLGQGGRPLSLHPPKGPGCLRGGTPFPRHLSESGNQEASLSQPRFLLSDSQHGRVWALWSLVSSPWRPVCPMGMGTLRGQSPSLRGSELGVPSAGGL